MDFYCRKYLFYSALRNETLDSTPKRKGMTLIMEDNHTGTVGHLSGEKYQMPYAIHKYEMLLQHYKALKEDRKEK